MITKEAIDRLLELGTPHVPQLPLKQDGDPFIVVPSSMKVESLAKLVPPTRIVQSPMFLEVGSFTAYVNRFKTAHTLIFAGLTAAGATFRAVLDYHGPTPDLIPGRCDHQATFTLVQTPEWLAWIGADRKPKNQVEFAAFLEDNLPLFAEPSGAELLELVQTLTGKQDVRFNSAVRLQSGANKLHFDEDVVLRGASTTKDGEVELPAILKAGIAPFQGAAKYEVNARLKYRIESRKLALWYETIGVHVILRDLIMETVKSVAEATEIIPLLGSP